MNEHPLISIVVVNWNGRRFVDSFLDSIGTQTYPSDRTEILFVDNGSTDDSVDLFLQRQPGNATLIRAERNLGYAGGNNLGLRAATGEYVAICNNDLELEPGCIEEMVRTALVTGADVVVPKLLYADTGLINNAGSMLRSESNWPNDERGMGRPADTPDFDVPAEVTAFCGACPMVSRTFLQEVGVFDRHFFLYWEDVDLSWRGQKLGKRYVYEPKAVALHHASGSTGGEHSPTFIRYVNRNRILVLMKHGRPAAIVSAFLDVARAQVLRPALLLCRSSNGGTSRRGTAARSLWLGIRTLVDALRLSPIMVAKRWGIWREDRV